MLGSTSDFAAFVKKGLQGFMTYVFYNWLGMNQHLKTVTVILKGILLTTLNIINFIEREKTLKHYLFNRFSQETETE